jgi:hypothetical protein
MFHAPVFFKPIHQQSYNNTQPQKWEEVIQSWKDKNYKESLYKIFDYLGISYHQQTTHFKIPHGSIQIDIQLKNDGLIIQAPFLSIESSLKLPLFRQILQINQDPLQLTQIQLKDDLLVFYFECPYPLCEPNKIFEVLKEICIHADLYDDTFIRKYRAKRISEPKIYPLSFETQEKCIEVFRDLIIQTEDAIQFLIKERQNLFLWDNFVNLFLKIDLILSPNGHIKSDIEKWIVEMHSQQDLSEKINIGNKAIQSLKKLSDDQIREDLYRIHTFVPLKELISREVFKNQFIQIQSQIQKEFQKGEYLAAYFTIQYQLLMLFYQYDLNEECVNLLLKILENACGNINETKIQFVLELIQEEIEKIPVSTLKQ